MADHANASDSEKRRLILKEYINYLETGQKFSDLKSLKGFRDIIAKPKSKFFKKYTFDDLSTDVAKLVANVTKGE